MASEPDKIKIGILGTGWVAGAHAEAFSAIPGCEVAALYSRDINRAATRIQEMGLSNAEPYDNLELLLNNPEIDVISICSMHHEHPQQTIAAAQAGKHLVIEKPLATSPEAISEMVSAVNKAGVKTSVCFELRFIGLMNNIKSFVDQGLLGNIFYGQCSYFHGIGPWYRQWSWNKQQKFGGSAILTAGCHALDFLLETVDSKVKTVSAVSNRSTGNPLEYDYDTNIAAVLEFENGTIGQFSTSIECRQPYQFPVLLQGELGTIWNDQISSTKWPGLKYGEWAKIPTSLPDSGDVSDHPYQSQFEHLLSCIKNDEEPTNSLANCLHTHEVTFAIDEAAKSGRKTDVASIA
ncbi:Gfo/Idh/MocA family protein [Calycomorphotria hydatis]|uniref:Putative oxidoreductase YcjS n=1 Tax=Calycomorphotria hydatis TaxID=2528027 RepID=A0A517T959_9PLAN|nr:Gfo/Idh/MocA family oxidoreductase [Calycomorphotria hydatis]QDT64889.1 putative oxidoreductase YcjS [Calycomorphotria hydatis]